MRHLFIILSFIYLSSCAPKTPEQISLINSSIMNGSEVHASDPLSASIVALYDSKSTSICTGSIIASNIILTAAHCVPARASDMKVLFTNNADDILNSREPDILAEYSLPVTDFKVSPTWDPENTTVEVDTGDIALIKFKGALPLGFKPATFLTDASLIKVGSLVTLAGFGVNYVDTPEISNPRKFPKLQEAIDNGEVFCDSGPVGKHTKCFKIEMSGDGILRTTEAPISLISDTEIRLNERKSGTCNGDSGGPAYIKKNGQYYLFGVTSRGSDICNEVGVYTNALTYTAWINETIKILK